MQARLVKYVRAKVQENPRNMRKGGRPLLDYALRPRRITPISMPYHSVRDEPSLDVDMVQLLLDNGADPNQPVHLNGGKSVWALCLLSIHETFARESGGPSSKYRRLNNAWYQTCRALIKAGARLDCLSNSDIVDLDAVSILNHVFGSDKAAILKQEMKDKQDQLQQSSGLCVAM